MTMAMLEPGTFPLDKVTHELLDLDDRHGDLVRNRHKFSTQHALDVAIDGRHYVEEIKREDAPEVFAAIDAYFARAIEDVAATIRQFGFEPTTVDLNAADDDDEGEDDDTGEEE